MLESWFFKRMDDRSQKFQRFEDNLKMADGLVREGRR